MFTSTWCVIAPILLFVLSMFLTCTGFSNFCSQNPCLAAIFLSINIPVVPLSKSTFTVILSWMSTFSILIFNHTFLNILNILLISLCLLFSFAVLFGGSLHMPPDYVFSCAGHTTLLSFLLCLGYPYHLAFSSLLSLRTSCPLLFSQYIPFFLYHLHSMQVTMTFPVIHPNSNNHASSGTFSTPQYSCIFSQLEHAGSSFLTFSCYCAFPFIGYAASSHFLFFFSISMFGYSHLQYPILLHLKHCTSSTTSCLLTFTSSLILYFITLLANTLNLSQRTDFPFFS